MELVPLTANCATAIGVCVALMQHLRARKHSVVQFEDSLTREFRQIIGQLPVPALLGEELSVELVQEHLRVFYLYFDLTNEQIFLRRRERVSLATWETWQQGIRDMMKLPAFERAWREIRDKPLVRFLGLRELERLNFESDPCTWKLSNTVRHAQA